MAYMKKPKRNFKLKVKTPIKSASKKVAKKAIAPLAKGRKLTAKHKAAISRALKRRK